MAALEQEAHPLAGVKSAYYLAMREPLSEVPALWRWLARFVYQRIGWASDYGVHDMGIFIDRDVAEEIARQKRVETGKAWSVKELPVNGLLPEAAVRYGFYSFPGSDADEKYRKQTMEFKSVPASDLKLVSDLETKVQEFASFAARGGG